MIEVMMTSWCCIWALCAAARGRSFQLQLVPNSSRIWHEMTGCPSHTPILTACTIYLHWVKGIIYWVSGDFVRNKHTRTHTHFFMSPCFFHVKRISTSCHHWEENGCKNLKQLIVGARYIRDHEIKYIDQIFEVWQSFAGSIDVFKCLFCQFVSDVYLDEFWWVAVGHRWFFWNVSGFALDFDSCYCTRDWGVLFAGRGGGVDPACAWRCWWKFPLQPSNMTRTSQDVARLKKDLRWMFNMIDWFIDWLIDVDGKLFAQEGVFQKELLGFLIAALRTLFVARVVRWLVPTKSRAVVGKSWVTLKKASPRLPSWTSKRHLCFNKNHLRKLVLGLCIYIYLYVCMCLICGGETCDRFLGNKSWIVRLSKGLQQ